MPPPRPSRPSPAPAAVRAQYQSVAQMISSGRASAAMLVLSQLRQARPEDPTVWDLLGSANAALARHAEAVDAYARAVALAPEDRAQRSRYAAALRHAGRYGQSLAEYDLLLRAEPNSLPLLRTRASLLIDLGRHAEAADLVRSLMDRRDAQRLPPPEAMHLALVRGRLAPAHLDPAPVIEDLQRLAAEDRVPVELRSSAQAVLGRLLEHAGRYDEAFAAFTAANLLQKPAWDPDAHTRAVDAMLEAWRSHRVAPLEADGSRLIFIVGMMRSGTSLTEQMIATDPSVTPGGELNAIGRQVATLDPPLPHHRALPTRLERYTPRALAAIRAAADEVYARVAPTGPITDKQPLNYFYLPLIARLYPGARIIHCTREPLDCCLSNFTQRFSRPHPYTCDLAWLGRYWRDYQRTMNAWRELGVAFLDLPYERLVADPEGESKRVFAHLALAWNESVLDFHASERAVPTASRDQVRRPVYTSSVNKHERYAGHLAPLRAALGID